MNYLDKNFHKISNNSVHVWLINFNTYQSKLHFFNEILSEDELTRTSKFRFNKDKNQFIITRGILRYLSGNYLKLNPKDISFKYGEFGKPDFNFDTTLKFNVSHAGELAVITFVKNSEIGIDIEYTKRDFEVFDIVDNYFSKKEIKALHKLPKALHNEAFYRGWTRKEAFIKAKSQGLSFPLDSFSISIDSDEKAELIETSWDKNEKGLWKIIPFNTETDYKAAIAIKGTIDSVKYFEFKSDFLE